MRIYKLACFCLLVLALGCRRELRVSSDYPVDPDVPESELPFDSEEEGEDSDRPHRRPSEPGKDSKKSTWGWTQLSLKSKSLPFLSLSWKFPPEGELELQLSSPCALELRYSSLEKGDGNEVSVSADGRAISIVEHRENRSSRSHVTFRASRACEPLVASPGIAVQGNFTGAASGDEGLAFQVPLRGRSGSHRLENTPLVLRWAQSISR